MSAHRWNHNICLACWNAQHPMEPTVKPETVPETHSLELCCFCEKPTRRGIYVRRNPDAAELKCIRNNR